MPGAPYEVIEDCKRKQPTALRVYTPDGGEQTIEVPEAGRKWDKVRRQLSTLEIQRVQLLQEEQVVATHTLQDLAAAKLDEGGAMQLAFFDRMLAVVETRTGRQADQIERLSGTVVDALAAVTKVAQATSTLNEKQGRVIEDLQAQLQEERKLRAEAEAALLQQDDDDGPSAEMLESVGGLILNLVEGGGSGD